MVVFIISIEKSTSFFKCPPNWKLKKYNFFVQLTIQKQYGIQRTVIAFIYFCWENQTKNLKNSLIHHYTNLLLSSSQYQSGIKCPVYL